ncbi:hypothetical protein GCM10011533_17740 [Streptosporangium jomthongense]|uniref:C-type cytochrome n=1 Tax=Marinobacter aromaticivorans TaxID=1494078 RepID=A0ABW2IVA2_9GAMM|nr:cytochrome c [Marinobacter aromaticivorans]GGE65870.1 hypothetical protein GCM10011533_17740 [Streptosporangium jomthongense]
MSKQQQSKDNFEPFELNNPIPWPVIAIALALAAWGIFTFLHSYMAAGENQQQAQQQAQQAGAEKSQGSGNAKAATDGAQLFDNYCSSCHQNNGAGVSGAIPPLAGSSWVLGDGEQVASIVLFGISGPISVQGKTFNGRMPTFGSTLSNGEIAAIVNHIRSSWGNSAGPINAELVQVQRERFSDRTIPWQGGAELRSHFNPARTAEGN